MRFGEYLADRAVALCVGAVAVILAGVFLGFTGTDVTRLCVLGGAAAALTAGMLGAGYAGRLRESKRTEKIAGGLAEKYLLSEVLPRPVKCSDGVYYDLLRLACKDMIERVTAAKSELRDYREYIERWVHEIKTPIATAGLICDNNPSDASGKIRAELDRTNALVEQVLYYARSGSVEKDLLIRKVTLSQPVAAVLAGEKNTLISGGMRVETEGLGREVYTDPKWLEFVLRQLVVNAVQYARPGGGKIVVAAAETGEKTALTVTDDGLGIAPDNLPRVCEKGFTGANGRLRRKATGMGLYLASVLCEKLGHKLTVDSDGKTFTRVTILFG